MRALVLLPLVLLACGDGKIHVGDDTDAHTGPNTAPTAPVVAIAPAAPGSGDDLVANLVYEATDADGDTLTYAYAWVVDGTPRADLASNVVPASATERGQTWQVYVRADDGREQGPPGTASATVANGAPQLAPTWAVAAPSTDDDLVVDAHAVDPDGDTVTLTYSWFLDGVQTGYVDPTVPASATVVGQTWRVVIAADDAHGGTSQAELSATVVNRPPTLTGLVVTPNPAHLRDTLVASFTTSDADNDALSIGYTWTVNGGPSGVSTSIVPGTITHANDTWVVTVVVDDGHGGVVSSSASTTVVNHPPVVRSVTVSPSPAGDGDTLVASVVAEDVDGDPLVQTVTWTRNGVVQPALTGAQVYPSYTFGGDVWVATASVSDGAVASAPVTSNAVTIVDLPPTTPAPFLTPAVPSGCGPLVCDLYGEPIDPDGTAVTVTIGWMKNGAAFTGTPVTTTRVGDTIAEADLTAGARFTCVVTATSHGLSSIGQATTTVPVGGVATETFTATARVAADVLLMVDDSCSMQDKQDQLETDLHVLLDELGRSGLDYHLGVVTSDVDLASRSGRLVQDLATGLRWITPSTPNALTVLGSMVSVGTYGSAYEQGLQATALALSEPLASGYNAGFLRPTGGIGLLYLSDEHDQSTAGTPTTYAQALRVLRPNPSDIVTWGIVGTDALGCTDPSGFSVELGTGYLEFLGATGGGASSICDASYAAGLVTFGGRLTGLPRRFTLSGTASSGIASVVQISAAGTRTTLTQGSAWTYDAAANQLVLTSTPATGTRFEVTYLAGCPVAPAAAPGDTGFF